MSDRNVVWHEGAVSRDERWAAVGQRGMTVWLTGLSGSGKSTIAASLEQLLVGQGIACYRLDGDNVRHGLNSDLGFGEDDRVENIRRIGEVAALLADAGVVAIVPVISPYEAGRQAARGVHDAAGIGFVEVFVDTPVEECERRDPKGLYAAARRGDIPNFTGISAPYEPPANPDYTFTPGDPVDDAARVLATLVAERTRL